jgi:hypothetical protein
MTTRRTGWIVGALAVALVLSMLAPGAVLVLAVPVAVVGSILTRRRPRGHGDRDVADRLLAAAATFTGEPTSSDGEQGDWAAALRAELATITVPRERRRFAVGAAVALLGGPHSHRSFVVAAGVAVAFGAGVLGVSRAGLGDDGLGSGDHAPSAGDAVRGLATCAPAPRGRCVLGLRQASWRQSRPWLRWRWPTGSRRRTGTTSPLMSASWTASTSPSTRPGQPSWARCIRSSFWSTSCSGRHGRSWAPGRGASTEGRHRLTPELVAEVRSVNRRAWASCGSSRSLHPQTVCTAPGTPPDGMDVGRRMLAFRSVVSALMSVV